MHSPCVLQLSAISVIAVLYGVWLYQITCTKIFSYELLVDAEITQVNFDAFKNIFGNVKGIKLWKAQLTDQGPFPATHLLDLAEEDQLPFSPQHNVCPSAICLPPFCILFWTVSPFGTWCHLFIYLAT